MKKQDREELRTSAEISVESSKFLRWLDNFWYHYKWPTIGIAFALVVVLVCVLQTCSKEKYDLTLVYAGPVSLDAEEVLGAEQALEAVMPADFDGDGEKNLALSRYAVYSKEQITVLEEQGLSINRQVNTSEYENYSNYILTGEASVYLIDPWLYESLKSADRLCPMEQVGVSGPSEDGFGVRLGDTAAYQKYELLKAFPEDTMVCLLRQQVIGKNHDDAHYANEIAMFGALVGGAP